MELLRADMRSNKVAVLKAAMQLTSDESKAFWPIFREYDTELAAIHDSRIDLITQYAEEYRSLTDEQAGEIVDSWFKLQQNLLRLKRKYYKKVKKASL